MRHLRIAVLAGLALVTTASAASAQRAVNSGAGGAMPWEWGVDFFGLSLGGDPSSTIIGLGGGVVRGGKFVSNNLSLEGAVGLDIFSTDGFSTNDMDILFAGLWHLQGDMNAQQIFIRPAVGMHRSSVESGGTTTSQTCNRIQVGVGVKRNMKRTSKLKLRVEGVFTNHMECGGSPSESRFGATAGVSLR